MVKIKLHNTLSNQKEIFEPIQAGVVSMYHCGPTLYDRQHIGNLSMFVFTDVLRRTIEYAGFDVKQVINFTDFGHLTGDNEGDADQGEDRMTKGLKREGLEPTVANMKVLAEKYATIFLSDLALLNVKTEGTIFPYASDFVSDQIKMIENLLEKEFAYEGEKAVYFDTSKFPKYGELGGVNLEGQKSGARVAENNEKKNPTDFVLWKKDGKTGWPSPWGLGFPGWHIECSAMIIKLLGDQIDIHTGGIEHIGVHHNNEIAQSESATGKSPFSKFWLHRAHLKIDDTKISKSLGNVVYLDDLAKRGIHPLSLRYLLLSSHYKTPANFSEEAVSAFQNSLEKIAAAFYFLPESDTSDEAVIAKFEDALGDDLNTAVALSVLQEAKSKSAIRKIDSVLGLDIPKLAEMLYAVPEEILETKLERDRARENKDWHTSDRLRSEIESQGFVLEDKENTSIIRKTLAGIV